jgi:four helix bundle protein
VAVSVVAAINELHFRRDLSHLRDHLIRAADNTALRLSEASGRTMGNRYQHLEAAYAETQEVQTDLMLIRVRGVDVPISLSRQADRLGGLIYGLLRAEARTQGSGSPTTGWNGWWQLVPIPPGDEGEDPRSPTPSVSSAFGNTLHQGSATQAFA